MDGGVSGPSVHEMDAYSLTRRPTGVYDNHRLSMEAVRQAVEAAAQREEAATAGGADAVAPVGEEEALSRQSSAELEEPVLARHISRRGGTSAADMIACIDRLCAASAATGTPTSFDAFQPLLAVRFGAGAVAAVRAPRPHPCAKPRRPTPCRSQARGAIEEYFEAAEGAQKQHGADRRYVLFHSITHKPVRRVWAMRVPVLWLTPLQAKLDDPYTDLDGAKIDGIYADPDGDEDAGGGADGESETIYG